MPLRFPVESFFQSSGNAAAAFTETVRDEVATFACSLWANYPAFFTENINPANSFARGFMNTMCSGIQTPVPPPVNFWTGGQCVDILYTATIVADRTFSGDTVEVTYTMKLYGPIQSIQPEFNNPAFPNVLAYIGVGNPGPLVPTGTNGEVVGGAGFSVVTKSITVTRDDGMPDNCGNVNVPYPSPMPTANDLNTIVNVVINDGLDLSLELQYVQLSNEYNFPMNFKVNGVNVSLDFGGINIYAPDGFGSPSGSNNVPPPGSDPSEDGLGNPIITIFNLNEYPVAPENPVPREVTELITYLVCNEGVIETIQTSLKLAVGFEPILSLIIDILGQILTDLCETPEASLGLPEYYGLRPGVDRPAIIYLWKEFVGGKWGASTYSSTVHFPTAAAIADIPNLTNIQKFTGQFRRSVALTDGSQIRTTGNTAAAADNNFTFLVNQVDPSMLPSPLIDFIVESEDTRIAAKTLTLRQVEYYPDGKKDNTSPSIRRVINPP